ncbi:hypothetical protein WN943_026087 [Citrus x changshan-huyou]
MKTLGPSMIIVGSGSGLLKIYCSFAFDLPDIIVNVGKMVDSEFETLSIDVAELDTMVFPLPGC